MALATTSLACQYTAAGRILYALWRVAPLVAPEVFFLFYVAFMIYNGTRDAEWELPTQLRLAVITSCWACGLWNAAAFLRLAWDVFITVVDTRDPVLWRMVASLATTVGSTWLILCSHQEHHSLPVVVVSIGEMSTFVVGPLAMLISWVCPYLHVYLLYYIQELLFDIWGSVLWPCLVLLAKWDELFVLLTWLGYCSPTSPENSSEVMRSQQLVALICGLPSIIGLAFNLIGSMISTADLVDHASIHVLWRVSALVGGMLLATAAALGPALSNMTGLVFCLENTGGAVWLMSQVVLCFSWVISAWRQECVSGPGFVT